MRLYIPTESMELDESDEEWASDSQPRKLNYQQLYYLASGMVLPRKTKASRDVIDFVKAQGAPEHIAHEIAAMSALSWNMQHLASNSR